MRITFIATILLSLICVSGVYAQTSCATAVPISAGTYTVTTINGESPHNDCVTTDTPSHANWFKYTPNDDYLVTISSDLPINLGGDTDFSVYMGTCDGLVCYAGFDDGGTLGTGFLAKGNFEVDSGVTYYIAWTNKWSNAGLVFTLIQEAGTTPEVPPVTFTEYTVNPYKGEYGGFVVDMNGDYLDDMVSLSTDTLHVYYQNTSSGFSLTNYIIPGITHMPSWSLAGGDYDRNGYNDLVLGGGSGVSFLKANATGTGYTTFAHPGYVFSQRTNFVDINNDGNLDIFVCHDVDTNVYFMNDGTGTLNFQSGGLGDHPNGGNYGSIWIDFDNDGDMDLFIAKCRGGGSTAKINQLFRNDGAGVFTDVSDESYMADPIQTWSAAWGDYDNDGDMDALVGASSAADGYHKMMRNNSDGTFTDMTLGSGWEAFFRMSVEYLAYDFDNDGWIDVYGGSGRIMRNIGGLKFAPFEVPFGQGGFGDLNNDGFIDVNNKEKVYYSSGNDNHWKKVTLQGVASNINGIGARISLYAGGLRQIREIRSGEGFRYMHTLNGYFGIGEATTIDSIVVKWPSGTIDKVVNPTIDAVTHIKEGEFPILSVQDGEPYYEGITVFPNPSADILNIEYATAIHVKELQVINNLGQVLLTKNGNSKSINVSALPVGNYHLLVIGNKGSVVKKFTVKR